MEQTVVMIFTTQKMLFHRLKLMTIRFDIDIIIYTRASIYQITYLQVDGHYFRYVKNAEYSAKISHQ